MPRGGGSIAEDFGDVSWHALTHKGSSDYDAKGFKTIRDGTENQYFLSRTTMRDSLPASPPPVSSPLLPPSVLPRGLPPLSAPYFLLFPYLFNSNFLVPSCIVSGLYLFPIDIAASCCFFLRSICFSSTSGFRNMVIKLSWLGHFEEIIVLRL